MDKINALSILKNQLHQIGSLKMQSKGQDYLKWHRDTEVAIKKIFVDTSEHIDEFRAILFSPMVYPSSQSDEQDMYLSGLSNAESMLASMIQEVKVYWPDQLEDPKKEQKKLVFISHKETDSSVADALINFLQSSLELKDNEIRCTSVPGYQLPYGETISELLKSDIHISSAIFALMTKDSLRSQWVMFELGASWALDKLVIPILGPGLTYDDLPGPLAEKPGVSISEDAAPSRLTDAIKQISETLSVRELTGGKRQSGLANFVSIYRNLGSSEKKSEDVTGDESDPLDFRVSFDKIHTTQQLHKYTLNVAVSLNKAPAQDSFRISLYWPSAVRITKIEGITMGEEFVKENLRCKELNIMVNEKLWPGESKRVVGQGIRTQLEYEFDVNTYVLIQEKGLKLFYKIFLPDYSPKIGSLSFSELNDF